MMVNIFVQIYDLLMGVDKKMLFVGVVQGCNDFGYVGFGGVCLLLGDKFYCYQFIVWVLNMVILLFDSELSGVLVGFMFNVYVIVKV